MYVLEESSDKLATLEALHQSCVQIQYPTELELNFQIQGTTGAEPQGPKAKAGSWGLWSPIFVESSSRFTGFGSWRRLRMYLCHK
jgi:hypothetical protein